MTRRVIYRFFAIEREDEGSWKIITKRIYLRVRVERKKKRGARVLRDDSTCLARLSPRDPRILQNHGGQLCKRLFGASVPAGSTGLNRNRVVQPTPSDRKLVRFRIETVPETRSPSRLPVWILINYFLSATCRIPRFDITRRTLCRSNEKRKKEEKKREKNLVHLHS